MVYGVECMVYSVWCIVYIIWCTVYSVKCKEYEKVLVNSLLWTSNTVAQVE